MKYFICFILIFMGMNLTFANNMEEVRLQNYEIKTINVPKNTEYEKIYSKKQKIVI